MTESLAGIPPAVLALLATCGTWATTAAGAAAVLLVREVNKKLLDGMLGFAAGVMMAATFWSLLAPAISAAAALELPVWLPPAAGFVNGALFLHVVDWLLPHLHPGPPETRAEGLATSWTRTTLLVLAVTLHNVPEGLAVGVAFGAAAAGLPAASLAGAVALTAGIALQNVPEGMAVSLPLRREGLSRGRAFWYGQLSGAAEPLAALVGAVAASSAHAVLPYVMSFAAGAMMFVVVEELIPASQQGGNSNVATAGAVLGFVLMMVLDVGLG
ncbi:MAG: ZIP family metal transporter [Desulfotomaculales bacterium]